MRRQHIRSGGSTRHLRDLSRRPAWAAVAVVAALALTLALAIVSHYQAATGPHEASAQSGDKSAELAVRRAGSGGAKYGYWSDTVGGTTYTAEIIPNADDIPAAFDFTVPGGGEITGTVGLIQEPDGSYAEGTSGEVSSTFNANPDSFPSCAGGTLQTDTSQSISFKFYGHFSADGLAAYATIAYVLTSDGSASKLFCGDNQRQAAGVTTYQLSDGCTATTCQDLASQVGPTVAAYDQDVVSGNFSAAYVASSDQITGQYTEQEFAAALMQQAETSGKITNISPPTTTPVVQYTPQDQPYFQAQQTITLDHNGAISTEMFTNYYLVQNGAWLFWFTS